MDNCANAQGDAFDGTKNESGTQKASSNGRYLRSKLGEQLTTAAGMLEIFIALLVLTGLLFSAVPLIKWMPGLLSYGNDVEIRTFLERALENVIGIEFIKMLVKHSPGSSLEVLMYAIARHMVIGQESALENLLSVCSIALIFVVRKYFFVPAFGAHLPNGEPAPDTTTPSQKLRVVLGLDKPEETDEDCATL